jgi:hypothetical protein
MLTPDSQNKCGPGQPPEPHCCRGYSDCRLSPWAKDHRAPGARESAQSVDVRLGFAPRAFPIQRFHPALEGRISEEAATPGHRFTGREPDFPRRFTLEESPATLNRDRQSFRHPRSDCRVPCGKVRDGRKSKLGWACAEAVEGRKFLVEREGKVGHQWLVVSDWWLLVVSDS